MIDCWHGRRRVAVGLLVEHRDDQRLSVPRLIRGFLKRVSSSSASPSCGCQPKSKPWLSPSHATDGWSCSLGLQTCADHGLSPLCRPPPNLCRPWALALVPTDLRWLLRGPLREPPESDSERVAGNASGGDSGCASESASERASESAPKSAFESASESAFESASESASEHASEHASESASESVGPNPMLQFMGLHHCSAAY